MTRRGRVSILVCLLCVLLSGRVQAAVRGGSARISITPPVGVWLSGYGARDKPSDDIQDDLYARALVLDDGTETVALIAVDLLWVPLSMTNEVRDLVQAKTGIPGANVMICASHTPFRPEDLQ